jgi:serine/threonine-protein kinase
VQVFDFNVTDNGVPFLVMELIEGKLLSQRIDAVGALDANRTANIIDQIASALHAAHARGIVHRDLKPENVMLLSGEGVDDFVKVLDFGISQASWRPRLTDDERVAGTPQYMAPEQACALREQIDHRSDQFSLAAIAYTLLTGQEPFQGENPIAVLYEVVHTEPALPSELVPALGAEIDAVIMRGLAKDSADRYPSVVAFAGALRAAIQGFTPAPFTEVTSEPPPVRASAPAPVPAWAEGIEFVPSPPEPLNVLEAPPSAGHDTIRLIRRMRGKMTNRTPRRVALLTLVAAGALAWFAPSTRGPARAAWHHAGTQMQIMFERIAPNREVRP